MAFSAWEGLANLADTTISDLGAFGVIGQPNIGGHQTTQVVRTNAAGVQTSISSSATSPVSQKQTYILIGAAILIVAGLFLLVPKQG